MSKDSSDTTTKTGRPWWAVFIPKKEWGILAGAGIGFLALFGPIFVLEPVLRVLVPLVPGGINIKIAVVSSVVTLLGGLVIAAGLAVYRKTFSAIGVGRPKFLYLANAVVGFLTYIAITLALQMFARTFFNLNIDETQELGYRALGGPELVAAFIPLVLITPVVEELIFRGFMFTGFRRHLPFWIAATGVSALFALVHGQWNVGLDVFAMSMVSCYLVEKTGSLWPSIFLHVLKNGVAFYILYLYNGG